MPDYLRLEAMRIGCAVVLFNKSAATVPVVQAMLARKASCLLLLVDNSTQPGIRAANASFSRLKGFQHLALPENPGLAVAYNRAIAQMRALVDFLVLFDDDTQIPVDFFECLTSAISSNPDCTLYAPLVYDRTGLLSPCLVQSSRCRRLKGDDRLLFMITSDGGRAAALPSGYSLINSGLALALDHLSDKTFDEDLFMDYVDHQLIWHMHQSHRCMLVFPAALQQAFAAASRSGWTLSRYATFLRDAVHYGYATGQDGLRLWLHMAGRGVKVAFKRRSLKPVVLYFRTMWSCMKRRPFLV